MPKLLTEARRLVEAGLSVIPVMTDGTKRPSVAWKPYQSRRPTAEELMMWFTGTEGRSRHHWGGGQRGLRGIRFRCDRGL
jgi:hypothetical protein